MKNLPTISNYGHYSSSNYGSNTLQIQIGNVIVWFSYSTPVAFSVNGQKVVHQNDWRQTTGKHLNWIDGGDKEAKKARVPSEEFARLWNELVTDDLSIDSISQLIA